MLSLSQTSGYAILALSCLSATSERFVLARDLALRAGVPLPYLSKILHSLQRCGLILGKRGYRGGFSLARAADRISLMDVVEAVDGVWKPRCLLGLLECSADERCPVHAFWVAERGRIERTLQSTTLAEFADFAFRRGLAPLKSCGCGGAIPVKCNMGDGAESQTGAGASSLRTGESKRKRKSV